ncbi:MAG: beta-ketoacyl-[acyl-carrier-protein] synthase II, partial [Deltaproteobacteria bacterium]|nr:beta-ketoacyl-[acyl-carrier-protein] synthase II [Deltaproteobacteria bacterium]
MERRAVITGLGMVTPLGIGKEENWRNLVAGKSGIVQMDNVKAKEISV